MGLSIEDKSCLEGDFILHVGGNEVWGTHQWLCTDENRRRLGWRVWTGGACIFLREEAMNTSSLSLQ